MEQEDKRLQKNDRKEQKKREQESNESIVYIDILDDDI